METSNFLINCVGVPVYRHLNALLGNDDLISPRFRQYVKDKKYLVKDFGIYGLEKVLVTAQKSEQKVANSMIMNYS